MEKRIPIDELFHDELYRGEEQLNLGAWANMERMLDGKNPYAEEKKKRRILPLFIFLLASIGIAGAGYLLKTSSQKADATFATTESNSLKSDVNKDIPTQTAVNTSTTNETGKQSNLPNAEVSNVITTNQTSTTAAENNKQAKQQTPTRSYAHDASEGNTVKETKHNNKQSSATNNGHELNNTSNTNAPAKQIVARNSKSGKVNKEKFAASRAHENIEKIAETKIASNTKNQAAETQDVEVATTKTEKIPVVTIQQKAIQNRDGSVKQTIDDTVAISTYEKVSAVPSNKAIASLDPMVSNPRFKKLSEEEELFNARKTNPEPKTNEVVTASTSSNVPVVADLSIATNQVAKVQKQTSYFQDLKKFAFNTYEKISNAILYSPKPDVYTGLNMGFNASLSNSKHNFGGFQGGFVMLRPINDYVSFITECKFFYRNNGGYTVNDSYYKILNASKDTAALLHQNAYSYQKDSTVRTYNFKNFYSLELPLMLQLNYRSFALYGGVNIAYNFKLKTTEKTRNYAVDVNDTIAKGIEYSFPIDKPSQYVKSDFASRFGLGYTVGASYSFSSQLYLDLRIAQNVWDNMKANSAREISNGFFKVPSIQFGVGYRFRNFKPDN